MAAILAGVVLPARCLDALEWARGVAGIGAVNIGAVVTGMAETGAVAIGMAGIGTTGMAIGSTVTLWSSSAILGFPIGGAGAHGILGAGDTPPDITAMGTRTATVIRMAMVTDMAITGTGADMDMATEMAANIALPLNRE